MALTTKQEKFCQGVVAGLSASDAYRNSYDVSENTTSSCINRMAFELNENPNVTARIKELREGDAKRTEISRDRVLTEIARLALSDPRKAFTELGDLLPVKDWPDEVAACIKSIKVTVMTNKEGEKIGELKEVQFWDKNQAADKLCKFLGLYETDNRQKQPLDDLSRDTLKLLKEKLSARKRP